MSATATAGDRRAAAVFAESQRCSLCHADASPEALHLVRAETADPELVSALGGLAGQTTRLWAAVCGPCTALGERAIARALLTRALREKGEEN